MPKFWQAYRGKPITLGIRAEHMGSMPLPDRPTHVQPIETDAVEHTGNESLTYFFLDGQRFVARLPADQPLTFNQDITLVWDINKCHFFDPETELAIRIF